jgi:hypothetical protein
MELHPIAIEFYFVNPACSAGHALNRRRQRRLDESWKVGPDAAGWRLRPGIRHGSHQAHRKRKLDIVVSALVPLHEILQIEGHAPLLQIAAAAKLLGDIAGHIRDHFSAVLKPTTRTGLL